MSAVQDQNCANTEVESAQDDEEGPSKRILDVIAEWRVRNSKKSTVTEHSGGNKPGMDDIFLMGSDEVIAQIHHLRSNFDGLKQVTDKLLNFEGSLTCIAQKKVFKPIKPKLCIVLDTNVLLLNMHQVKSIRKKYGHSNIRNLVAVILPFVVQQELDVLRYVQSKMPYMKSLAVQAFGAIHQLLMDEEFQFWPQTDSTAFSNQTELVTNEDKLINCCLEYKKKLDCEVVLFSNDYVMADKAYEMRVDVCSVSKLPLLLKKKLPVPLALSISNKCNSDDDCKNLFQEWSLALRSLLGNIVTAELKAVYGDKWLDAVIVKPPWTLPDLLTCFDKHWDKEFSTLVSREATWSLKKLLDELNLNSKPSNLQKLDLLLNASSTFLSYFESIPNFLNQVKITLEKFKKIKKSVHKAIGETNVEVGKDGDSSDNSVQDLLDRESSSRISLGIATPDFGENEVTYSRNSVVGQEKCELEIVKKQFARNWNFIHHSCGMIIDSLSGRCPFPYTKPTSFPTKRETMAFIGKFYPALINLKSCLTKVLDKPQQLQTSESNPYQDLCVTLDEFLFSLFKEIERYPREVLTPEMLVKFIENQKAR
ncbi:RNA endoribonuclease, variant 2 [Chamberlinius hualienensis]